MNLDQRARTHLKAVVEAMTELAQDENPTIQSFAGGLLCGVAMATRIADGWTAEAAMEEIEGGLSAALGRAYLNGTLPNQPQPPTA